VTVFGVATALAKSPVQVNAMQLAEWEIASHGYKWIEYKNFSKKKEKNFLQKAIKLHTAVTGLPPKGWYLGRCTENTVTLASEFGSFEYISDSYDDDLPYWIKPKKIPQLIIPYTLDANDMRFATQQGFNSWSQFFDYLKGAFDIMYKEGLEGSPKMMSIGLHCRLSGRPGRLMALQEFIKYTKSFKDVWYARRIDIAEHWKKYHPPVEVKMNPYEMTKRQFIGAFGNIFEHSSWVAEKAFSRGLNRSMKSAEALHGFLCFEFRMASNKEKLKVLKAHPDLALDNKNLSQKLTISSKVEQKSAGLTSLSDTQQAEFNELNQKYKNKFKHPFIIAVKGKTRAQILRQFKIRYDNTKTEEFINACNEVEKIAYFRIKELFLNS
jgi:urate oxidase